MSQKINAHYVTDIINYYKVDVSNEKLKNMNIELFHQALTHESYIHIKKECRNYQILEFLGDSVIHFILTEYLVDRYGSESEGFITRFRTRIERTDSFASLSTVLGLNNLIKVHKINITNPILEDVFEAFIGAFYLSFGLFNTKDFFVKLLESTKDFSGLINNDDNYKDLVLRYFHQKKWGNPIYEDGDGAKSSTFTGGQTFIRIIKNNDTVLAYGKGYNKKIADKNAAYNALCALKVIVNNKIDPNWIQNICVLEDAQTMSDENNELSDDQTTCMINVHNPNNKLITKDEVKELLSKYDVKIKVNDIKLKLFNQCFTHKSYLKKNYKIKNNEDKACVSLQSDSYKNLKLLGDSLIHYIISEYLFVKYPDADEGFMTKLRSKIEMSDNLNILAKTLKLNEYVLLSRKLEDKEARNNVNINSSVFQSFISTTYILFGIAHTKNLMINIINKHVNVKELIENETNYKDLLMRFYHHHKLGMPVYKLIEEDGPGHSKIFTMGLYYKNKLFGSGIGTSKQRAEQIASKEAYEYFTNVLRYDTI
jgi:dsRNA-specific ribonuclease